MIPHKKVKKHVKGENLHKTKVTMFLTFSQTTFLKLKGRSNHLRLS